jgi:hypothetical protein
VDPDPDPDSEEIFTNAEYCLFGLHLVERSTLCKFVRLSTRSRSSGLRVSTIILTISIVFTVYILEYIAL